MPDELAPHSTPEDLEQRVINVIASTQHIPPGTISIDSTFEELKIDSLDGINILFAVENEFNINIPDDAAQTIKTVRQMVDGIRKLIENGQGQQEVPVGA
jgi:acyl carrier protein